MLKVLLNFENFRMRPKAFSLITHYSYEVLFSHSSSSANDMKSPAWGEPPPSTLSCCGGEREEGLEFTQKRGN